MFLDQNIRPHLDLQVSSPIRRRTEPQDDRVTKWIMMSTVIFFSSREACRETRQVACTILSSSPRRSSFPCEVSYSTMDSKLNVFRVIDCSSRSSMGFCELRGSLSCWSLTTSRAPTTEVKKMPRKSVLSHISQPLYIPFLHIIVFSLAFLNFVAIQLTIFLSN